MNEEELQEYLNYNDTLLSIDKMSFQELQLIKKYIDKEIRRRILNKDIK